MKVYSNYPLRKGVFVFKSRELARVYAQLNFNANVYLYELPEKCIQWVNAEQGQVVSLK